MHAADREHAGDAPAGADDHLAADVLAQDPVGRADVVHSLGRDGRRLQAEPVLDDRASGLVDDAVACRSSAFEGEVELRKRKFEADDVRLEHA